MRYRDFVRFLKDALVINIFGVPHQCSDATYESAFDHAKHSWLGKFYYRKIRNIPFLRWGVRKIWNGIRPFYSYLMFIHIYATPLVKMSHYIAANGIKATLLHRQQMVKTPPPVLYPAKLCGCLSFGHNHYVFPDIKLFQIENGKIRGHSNFVIIDDITIHHDLYDLKNELTVEEVKGAVWIDIMRKRIKWYAQYTVSNIDRAATFVEGCAANYAHWLSEVLPRIAVFAQCPDYAGVPLLVNEGLHPNIIDSIGLVAPGHPIIFVGGKQEVRVGQLIVISSAGYVPYDPRRKLRRLRSQGLFSPYALGLVREKGRNQLPQNKDRVWPRKIFVRRCSVVRSLKNGPEIERMLISQGFEVIAPEKLSFNEQCDLFAHADVVVIQAGAACVNVIFCKPEAKIFILVAGFKGNAFWYWQHMALAVGCRVAYVLGTIDTKYDKSVHADFIVDPKDITYALAHAA